ncbi:MAG: hypothetical protein GY694_22985 [Gammaproteobacteria bacterium]|nr:hypothetical protein [Gammaproteobacteria bacterium]
MKTISIYLLIICAFLITTTLHASERIIVIGTKITIIPPSGFSPAKNFPGFMQEKTGASVMVSEIPAPFSKITAGFTTAGLSAQGMSLISKETINKGANSRLLLHIGQQAYGRHFLKWIYVLGSELNTTMITATFPADLEQVLSENMKISILSSSLRQEGKIDTFEGLLFVIEESSSFKIAKRISNMLIMTEGGVFNPKPAPDPAFIVGSSISQGLVISDKKTFSHQRAKAIKTMTNTKIISTKPITLNGISGYEIVANSIHLKSNEPLFVYQVTLFDETDYFLMQGFALKSKSDKYMEEFKKLAHSFKTKP